MEIDWEHFEGIKTGGVNTEPETPEPRAAADIFLAGNPRYMMPNSFLMLHRHTYYLQGCKKECYDQSEQYTRLIADIDKKYRKNLLSKKELRGDAVYLTADEVAKRGFCKIYEHD